MDVLGNQVNQMRLQRMCAEGLAPATNVQPTMTEILQRQKTELEARLASVNEALAALSEHPEIEHIINLLGRINL